MKKKPANFKSYGKSLLKKIKRMRYKGKLIQKLTLLIAAIFVVSTASSFFIYYHNQQVTNNSLALEEAADLQQRYTLLLSEVKQIGLTQLQLVTSGYESDRVENLQESLHLYEQNYNYINDMIEGDEALEHYFSHFGNAFSTYEELNERYFLPGFEYEDRDRVRSRVTPHIVRTEDNINSVDDRIHTYLENSIDEARSELHSAITTTTIITITGTVFLVLVPLLFLLLFGKNVSSGVRLVMDRIEAYKAGNLHFKQSKTRYDEFHDINTALEEMGTSLRDVLESNEQAGKEVTHVAEQTSKASSEQLTAMEKLLETIHHFSNELDQQTDFTTTISSTTEQVSASSQEMQSSVELMTSQVNEVGSTSNQGVALMRELQETMKQLNENTEIASRKVSDMEQQLNEISAFMEGIDNIASQTNLLALNASIEATRAGAAGRSFSVVATEIRKLSSETNEFSTRTKEILANLGEETIQVVSAFDSFLIKSIETLEKTDVASTKFQDISEKNNHLTTQYNEMILSIEQINEAMESVVESVSQLVEGANYLQKNNHTFKGVIEKQTLSQKELTKLIASLYDTAQSLKKSS
ncbi:methyl-accepting chemotaxis protein [Evansella cellulosilytica]|uniref:Methyl-accepting chemotaxis sensory transducer n=1 Tax=Evansella cellulosilytica (strain ATCC 21833 / DSM 2522 / FERM P-1141 / JCM 9156 / N-4) TaxID=649639 RepID=E6TXZ8_EVAC2|nr:methyl-accepting chemotaxis protein [Evansella cellulosilytica]ADU31211.1 methyl-accepting chemotaxis sensory transducer [Evansella cellulosilytica DSM 2522]